MILVLVCTTVGAMAQTDDMYISRRQRRMSNDDTYYEKYSRAQRDSIRAAQRALRLSAVEVSERVAQMQGYRHTYNAGLYLSKAEKAGFVSMGLTAAGAVLTTIGAVKDNDGLMYVGLGLDAAALVAGGFAMYFRLQSGKELRLGAGCIQYNF